MKTMNENEPFEIENKGKGNSDVDGIDKSTSTIIRPALHHIGIMTLHLDEMVDWYGKVLGTKLTFKSSSPLGKNSSMSMRGVWVTNDKANHRIALVSWPGLRDDPQKHTLSRLQHVAFEYETIEDLLNTYARLKKMGIEPVIAVDHGPTTSFYYEDPDRNSVELFVDNFGNWDLSTDFMRTSEEFQTNPFGTFVDPGKLASAHNQGMSLAELHRRAYAGEFKPSVKIDPSTLL